MGFVTKSYSSVTLQEILSRVNLTLHAWLQVVHRALSCPQKNLHCFYTATATESDVTSWLPKFAIV